MVLMFRAAGSRSRLRVSVCPDEITVWLPTFQQPLRLSSAARAYTRVSRTTDGVGRCAGVPRAPSARPLRSPEREIGAGFNFERGPLFDPPCWYHSGRFFPVCFDLAVVIWAKIQRHWGVNVANTSIKPVYFISLFEFIHNFSNLKGPMCSF